MPRDKRERAASFKSFPFVLHKFHILVLKLDSKTELLGANLGGTQTSIFVVAKQFARGCQRKLTNAGFTFIVNLEHLLFQVRSILVLRLC
jgi:hypothetical protein